MSNIKDTRNYLVGNVATKALGFISIPFFTHYLSVEEYGIMSLYVTILSFLVTTLGLGILGSFKRYYFEKENNFGEFLYSNLVFLLVSSSFIGVIYFYYLDILSNYLKIPTDVLKYTFFISIMFLIIRVKLDFLQIREKSSKNAFYIFIQSLLSIFFSIAFILILHHDKYMGKIYGDFLAYFLLFIYFLYKLFKIMELKFNLNHIKYALIFGLPALPSMYASFGLAFADRLMINNITNTSDVGVYSFASTIAILVQIVILSVGKSWQPLFYKSLANDDIETLNKTFLLNAKIVFSASLFIIFFAYEFVNILATKDYLQVQNIIMYLVFGYNFFFLYTIYVQYTSYAKKTYWDSIITISSVILNISLNYYFIPKYGFMASAITTLISYIFMFLGFYLVAKYILKFKVVDLSIVYRIIGYYIIGVILFLFLRIQIPSYWLLLTIKLFILFFFIIILFESEFKKFRDIFRIKWR